MVSAVLVIRSNASAAARWLPNVLVKTALNFSNVAVVVITDLTTSVSPITTPAAPRAAKAPLKAV